MGPIPLVGTVKGVPDINAVIEGVFRIVGDISQRWDKGLVFLVGLLWVFVVDLGVLIVVALWHGQCMTG